MSEYKINEALGVLIEDRLSSGQTFSLPVITSSMSPFIKPNDKIIISRIPPEDLKPGDIVVFKRQSEFYVHRLLSKKGFDAKLKLITKGDNSLVSDEPILKEDFLGKVIAIKKADKSVNLENKFWKIINSSLGAFFFWEAVFYNCLRQLKRSITRI